MKCINCPFTERVQRRYGVTTHCTKDPTHMDVTYFTHERHVNEDNNLCPLRREKHIKDSTELSGGHLW